jgi:hypothetical protein
MVPVVMVPAKGGIGASADGTSGDDVPVVVVPVLMMPVMVMMGPDGARDG